MHEIENQNIAPKSILVGLDTGEYDAELSMKELAELAEKLEDLEDSAGQFETF